MGTVGTGCLLELSILFGEEKYPFLAASNVRSSAE